MKVQHALILTVGLLLANTAFADDGAALLKKNNCGACHHATNKTVGPSLKSIAEKYKGDAGAAEKLAKRFALAVQAPGEPCPCQPPRRRLATTISR